MLLEHNTQIALIVFLLVATIAIIYFPVNDLYISRSVRSERKAREYSKAAAEVPFGANGDLFEVLADYNNGTSKSSYVRPATAAEEKSAEAAGAIDGAGIFAIVEGGAHILPGSDEWAVLIAPQTFTDRRVKYFRVA